MEVESTQETDPFESTAELFEQAGPSEQTGPFETESLETEAFEAEPFGAEPFEAEPFEAEPFEAEPFEAQPFERQIFEPQSLGTCANSSASPASSSTSTTETHLETSPTLDSTPEDEGDNCRICRGEGNTAQPLFYPCKCSGSIRYVHQDCLMEWLSHSQKKYCELCKTPFQFTKLYDQSMPQTLPMPLFLRQMTILTVRELVKWVRAVVVSFVWLFWLPWSIRQVWRGLLWLSDGSWVLENDLGEADWKALTAFTKSRLISNTTFDASNSTVNQALAERIPQAVAPISGFLGLSSGDFLLVKIFRLLVPDFFRWTYHFLGPGATGDTLIPSGRQPSLLSDVNFLKSLTRYPMLNNGLVDVLEGEIICLVIIAAFILVFLIREWVVNQQPIANMPDPDRPEALPAAANDEAAQAPRRRRRVRRVQDQNERPIAVPRAPRAVPAEGIDINQDDVPLLATLIEHSLEDVRDLNDDTTQNVQETRPTLPDRLATDDILNIRRNIEERRDRERPDVSEYPRQSDRDDSDTVPLGQFDYGPDFRMNESESLPSTIEDVSAVHLSTRNEPQLTTSSKVAASSQPQPTSTIGNDANEYSSIDMQDQLSDAAPFSDDYIPTPGSTVVTDATDVTDVPTQNLGLPDEIEVDVRPESFLEQIATWLWHTDGFVDAHEAGNEHVAQDANAEAHFVPVQPLEDFNPHNIPEPPVPQPDLFFGVDLNDPDAIDDAEDLDGVLELIGMRGPITNMIQNVIFSEFLITLTIAASVWLPYIWGKIALVTLANPIGVSVKGPLYLVSRIADVSVDVLIFILGLIGCSLTIFTRLVKMAVSLAMPSIGNMLDASHFHKLSLNIAKNSGQRLEKVLTSTITGIKPDLPTFSILAHHSLRTFETRITSAAIFVSDLINLPYSELPNRGFTLVQNLAAFEAFRAAKSAPSMVESAKTLLHAAITALQPNSTPDDIDSSLIRWSTQDKAITIILGYVLFACVGSAYLRVARLLQGLKPEEKVDGIVADSLRQAGGVVKVIVIIGIEMIMFPLYCGVLLDIALMPLFNGATLSSRVKFMISAPMTGLFVHWFIGTCYMFHFALFVSMCRKIFRKGVLYFIRDPDDPTFHPVRDVLERPVATQLGKIAFSAFVYGGLVILCLGGVVWTVSGIDGVLPIRWATDEPQLAFPVDVIFYNFILAFVIRKVQPSKKISTMYEWWFRGCARGLRLSHFLFGEERDEEKGSHIRRTWAATFRRETGNVKEPVIGEDRRILAEDREVDAYFLRDGSYVRVPASDSVRIKKGDRVFLEVTEDNVRVDGLEDHDKGMHGKSDERFTKIYIPPRFQQRIVIFVFLMWCLAATTGVAFTIVPLLIGRKAIQLIAQSTTPPNDLYALTAGVHICGVGAYTITYRSDCTKWIRCKFSDYLVNTRQLLPQIYETTVYALGLLYMAATFGFVLPLSLSLLPELYLTIPLYTYLTTDAGSVAQQVFENLIHSSPAMSESDSPPLATMYILQTWALGLLWLRIALTWSTTWPCPHTRPAVAIKSIISDGIFHPNIRLATRAFILPCLALCSVLIFFPLGLGWLWNAFFEINALQARTSVFRYAYPTLLCVGAVVWWAWLVRNWIGGWRIKIRDEVYLIGERLHNFQEVKKSSRAGRDGAVGRLERRVSERIQVQG